MLLAVMLLAQTPVAAQTKDAKAALFETLGHYQTLTTFSATIEHDESSGLFPGKYTSSFSWKKGGHFELIVTKPQVFAADAPRKNEAPNYYADGATVTSVYKDGHQTQRTIENEPNTSPGWDVAGGLIMSFLQKTTTEDMFRNPPAQFKMTYSFGDTKIWKSEAVRDIKMTFNAGGQDIPVHIYLAADAPKLLGMSAQLQPDKPAGTMYYKDQKENPVLPATLGTVPSK